MQFHATLIDEGLHTIEKTNGSGFSNVPFQTVEGDWGSGDQEKRGRKVYGRWGQRRREAAEIGGNYMNYATLHNILQLKKRKWAGANKTKVGGNRD